MCLCSDKQKIVDTPPQLRKNSKHDGYYPSSFLLDKKTILTSKKSILFMIKFD